MSIRIIGSCFIQKHYIPKNILDTFTPFNKNLNDNTAYSLLQKNHVTACAVNNLATALNNTFAT
jgi:hypothetical protein